ncbi:uncharacterized protein BXZ73DRAFT_38764 [Epithele typhae]|uniref:uncharacterized protein n=1 Tax=Epithele typhae TaxID=378194 RepID=UPI002007ED69|nr:uncharacterized protein BXZ73DRAFT_38764 [Epithele typhae]KAH9945269.1 hypothetical protein BXZ73DRAFT_38764 [Epithele typhae]
MDNPQYYQPLSHALNASFVSQSHPSPRQHYSHYAPHPHAPVTNGAGSGHREEEEEEDDDDEAAEGELDHHELEHPHHSASSHSSPRVHAAHPQSSSSGSTAAPASTDYRQPAAPQDQNSAATAEDGSEKRKPGRPRGSRNRKPRVSSGSTSKAPANTQHPGFYQYPPAPGANMSQQNQQFYEFQWRALNLCSEFYNAAEELVKAASPMVIAQCYQMGPATKIDPLMLIAEAKRVCDNLLANPSQLVGQPVPTTTYPPYAAMPPPPPPGAPTGATPAPGSVITNPQTFVMPLNATPMAPPAQPYYPPIYAPPAGARYPTTPYYYPPPQGATPYYAAAPPPPAASPPASNSPPAPAAAPAPAPPQHTPTPTPSQPVPQPAPAPAPAPPIPSNAATISTFSAATGNTAPGGHQGTWSEEETDRLKRLAEQSKEMGNAPNKGEIEWDWVIHQWGNSRTRHQILLKATSLGLKESTTRGTKRRRHEEPTPQPQPQPEPAHPPPPPPQVHHQPVQQNAIANMVSPTRSPMTAHTTPVSNASPAMQPQRPPSSATSSLATPRQAAATTSPAVNNLPWPLPTMAGSTSILSTSPAPAPQPQPAPSTAADQRGYYRPRPTGTTSYGAAAAAASTVPNHAPSQHPYMYRPNGTGRRDSGA